MRVGLIGLGAMGQGLSANLVDKGIGVVAWDRSGEILNGFAPAEDGSIEICRSLSELISKLELPRCIILSIPGGTPVDEVLALLAEKLNPGDIVAECGNSYFRDTKRREAMMRDHGVALLGLGVSGGPEGARKGPAIMAGGDYQAWEKTRGIFNSIAAKVDGVPCCHFFGVGGAGHFVKMIHNGIEYAIMHVLMETYAILERSCGLSPERIAAEFEKLNSGATACFLMHVSTRVAGAREAQYGRFLIDVVDDAAGQKGTGRWTVQTALELGVASPTLAEAVMSRSLSSSPMVGNKRNVSKSPPASSTRSGSQTNIMDLLPSALALAFASAFIQGLSICDAADTVLDQGLKWEEILNTWRGGCILEGAMVEILLAVQLENGLNDSILANEAVMPILKNGLEPLRKIVMTAVLDGVPCSGLASALAYVEALHNSSLPTAFLQLQRDYFGLHGLKDRETGGVIKHSWSQVPGVKRISKEAQ